MVRAPRRYRDPMSVWLVPLGVFALGSAILALRAWTVWREAQALARSLVALRVLAPEVERLHDERIALAAGLVRILRH
jgi:hypothetical protein